MLQTLKKHMTPVITLAGDFLTASRNGISSLVTVQTKTIILLLFYDVKIFLHNTKCVTAHEKMNTARKDNETINM